MNVTECIKSRRSIRKYKPDLIDRSMIDSIVSLASFSPSWKNTQITRYIAIQDSSILRKITEEFTYEHNAPNERYPDEEPQAPKHRAVEDLLQYR